MKWATRSQVATVRRRSANPHSGEEKRDGGINCQFTLHFIMNTRPLPMREGEVGERGTV